MSHVTPPAAGAAGAPCKFCKSPLVAGARYCTACEKFQSPWDRLDWAASSTTLVSLISVGSLAYAFVAGQIKNAAPQVVLTPVLCSAQEVRLSLANLGDKPALFLGGTISTLGAAGAPAVPRTLIGTASPSLIPAQSNRIETFQAASMSAPHLPLPFAVDPARPPACRYNLRLSWTDGRNRRHDDLQSCACDGE